jgi:sulfur-oxidizing protein SoxY
MTRNTNRRIFFARCAALAALPFAGASVSRAQTRSDSVQTMLSELTAGAPLRNGRVRLDIPVLADNANSVALKVSVDSPMTPSAYVKSVHVYAERNPRPNIANFYLGPHAGRAEIATRIRLATSQSVLAVAAMSDGTFWSGAAEVSVSNAACYDES